MKLKSAVTFSYIKVVFLSFGNFSFVPVSKERPEAEHQPLERRFAPLGITTFAIRSEVSERYR